MKWKKLGKLFDPTQHALPLGCEQFAQSPQALLLEDGVRIYFSTRKKDPVVAGKYLSHVCYVDFDRSMRRIIGIAGEQVISLGALGCFDEHGIFPMHVFRHEDRILAYPSGWTRRASVSVDTGIGLAESHDGGRTFQRLGEGPVLGATLHEPFLVGDPFVRHESGLFHMWYIFGTTWRKFDPDQAPDRTYKIGHATSPDGVQWTPDGGKRIVEDVLGADESQALPTVVKIADRYHMYFCYRESFDFRRTRGRGYRIGHAYSDDLATWTRADDAMNIDVSEGDWDSDMLCYPHVFQCDGKTYMLYNGNEFGRTGFGLAVLE